MTVRERWAHFMAISTLTRIAIGLSVVFWLLESLLHVLLWENADLVVELFTPPGHEIWMRLVIISLFVGFGYYGDKLIYARRRAEEPGDRHHGARLFADADPEDLTMPVEIKELVVRAVVRAEAEDQSRTADAAGALSEEKETAIVEACVKEVLKVLRRSKER